MRALRYFNVESAIALLPCLRALAARICGMSLLLALCACSKTIDLQSGLNDADANEIVTVLNRHGIQADKRQTKEGVALSVKDSDISRATDAMRAAGLPRRSLDNLGQVFKKEGMISTPLEERIRYIHGLSAELEYTLQQFDHVVAARVHVVLPERIAPGEPIQPSSAAVFIKYVPPLDEDAVIPRVRSLVASSIPGLAGDDAKSKVSVVLTASETVAPAIEWTTVGPFRVMADSAGSLMWTMAAMALVLLVVLAGGGIALAMRNEKIAAAIKSHFSKARPFDPEGNGMRDGAR